MSPPASREVATDRDVVVGCHLDHYTGTTIRELGEHGSNVDRAQLRGGGGARSADDHVEVASDRNEDRRQITEIVLGRFDGSRQPWFDRQPQAGRE
jgi:hypothetical protein